MSGTATLTRADRLAQLNRARSPLEALRELLALHAIALRLDADAANPTMTPEARKALTEAFDRRRPLAWEAAQAAVAAAEERAHG